MPTIEQIAGHLGVSGQTIRNNISDYSAATGVDFKALGIRSARDKRKINYPVEAVNALIQWIDPEFPLMGIQPEAVASPVASVTTFTTGNHREQLTLPDQPAAVDLAAYRGEDAALTSFEPEDIERFLEACDGFVAAIDADYEYQKAVTARKEAAAAKVKAKAEQVKQAQMLYQIRSESLALHNRGLDAELKEGMSTLGKPAAYGD